jgi:hypothetical protein
MFAAGSQGVVFATQSAGLLTTCYRIRIVVSGFQYCSGMCVRTDCFCVAACRPERDRQVRTVIIDGYEVLKVNNYDAEAGGISAWEETGGEHSQACCTANAPWSALGLCSTTPSCALQWLLHPLCVLCLLHQSVQEVLNMCVMLTCGCWSLACCLN